VTYPIALGARYLTSRLGSLDRSATSLDTAIVSRALQVNLISEQFQDIIVLAVKNRLSELFVSMQHIILVS
jgi:hypothetical protein